MTFAPIRPSSDKSLNCEMQETIEKKITGPMTIFSALMNMVLIGSSRYVSRPSETAAGNTDFIRSPQSRPISRAAVV